MHIGSEPSCNDSSQRTRRSLLVRGSRQPAHRAQKLGKKHLVELLLEMKTKMIENMIFIKGYLELETW